MWGCVCVYVRVWGCVCVCTVWNFLYAGMIVLVWLYVSALEHLCELRALWNKFIIIINYIKEYTLSKFHCSNYFFKKRETEWSHTYLYQYIAKESNSLHTVPCECVIDETWFHTYKIRKNNSITIYHYRQYFLNREIPNEEIHLYNGIWL